MRFDTPVEVAMAAAEVAITDAEEEIEEMVAGIDGT